MCYGYARSHQPGRYRLLGFVVPPCDLALPPKSFTLIPSHSGCACVTSPSSASQVESIDNFQSRTSFSVPALNEHKSCILKVTSRLLLKISREPQAPESMSLLSVRVSQALLQQSNVPGRVIQSSFSRNLHNLKFWAISSVFNPKRGESLLDGRA